MIQLTTTGASTDAFAWATSVKVYKKLQATYHVNTSCPLPTGRKLRKCQMRRLYARRREVRRRWL